MTNQAELQPTINGSGEDSALPLTEEKQIGHEEIAFLLANMADDYVSVSRSPQAEYKYLLGHTEDKYGENETGEVVLLKPSEPYYHVDTKEEVLKAKRENLQLYTVGAIRSNTLKFDTSSLPSDLSLSMDELVEYAASAHVEDSLLRSEARFDARPAHISFESENEDPESAKKFIDVLKKGWKDLGSAAIHAIQSAPSLFSHPTHIIPKEPTDDRELLNDPAHAAEVTIAVNVNKVTPDEVRAM